MIPAVMDTISQDAVSLENIGLAYLAKVALQRDYITAEQRRVTLSPGMAVTIEIKTGKRRLIEYFLSPLLRYRQESVREKRCHEGNP